ncbi:MAG: hypothetical protein EXR98_07630 [Gemmataceae bacterium]|nr:hypothetical protein [Gemmataceae bacterium]
MFDALERYPKKDLLLFHRNSSYGQAGKGKVKLNAKATAFYNELRANVPWDVRRIRRTVQAVEEGKLSKGRPIFLGATDYAKKHDLIVVAYDLSRFIRSESYCRQTNPEAWPTPEELGLLHEKTGGVILATFLDPALTEAERHPFLTNLTRKSGRPRKIDDDEMAQISDALGYFYEDRSGRSRWQYSLSEIASYFNRTVSAIQRALDRVSPTGETWRYEGYRKAAKLGLVEIRENGDIYFPAVSTPHYGSKYRR